MATSGEIVGTTLTSSGYPADTIVISNGGYTGVLSAAVAAGARTFQPPYNAPGSKSGSHIAGYWDSILKDNILAMPGAIDFGVISQTMQLSLLLWNTHDHTVTLQLLTIEPQGLSSNFNASDTIGAMLDRLVYITALLEGDAIISGRIIFTFDTAQVVSILASGLRGLLFLYRPLAGTYEETDMFADNIFTSLNGSEVREKYATVAKKAFKYALRVDSAEQFNEAQNKIHAAAKVPVFQPIWSCESFLTQTYSGGVTVRLDTALADMQAGDLLILYQSETFFDVQKISAVGTGQVTIEVASTLTFPAGTLALPARAAYMAQSIKSAPEYAHMGAWTKYDISAVEV